VVWAPLYPIGTQGGGNTWSHTFDFDFAGKRRGVTGGSSWIGRAAVELLCGAGARVLATGTSAERLAAVETSCPGVMARVNDAGDPAAADALAAAVRECLGGLDGAFLNAGTASFEPLPVLTAEAVDRQFAVNVRGPMLQVRALAPLIADGGAVVLNTSIARESGLPGAAAYAASKGALRSLVRVGGGRRGARGVRVTAVSPGPLASGVYSRAGMAERAVAGSGGAVQEKVPLGRFGTPEEAARVALFLLSGLAAFVTGSEYVVDGGLSEV
ncbi:SDR family oxidoreductase, partial [Thiohalocapsa sp.]|uniref:SDR family oxidoreductase n=1 Tax=Thiohalocapsa sp. TaxID=2497641 RepID=UPI0025F322F7